MSSDLDDRIKSSNHIASMAERRDALIRANESHDVSMRTALVRLEIEALKAWDQHLLEQQKILAESLKNEQTINKMNWVAKRMKMIQKRIYKAEKKFIKQLREVSAVEQLFSGRTVKRENTRKGWYYLQQWLKVGWFRRSRVMLEPSTDFFWTTDTGDPVSMGFVSVSTAVAKARSGYLAISIESDHFEPFRNIIVEAVQHKLDQESKILTHIDAEEARLFAEIDKLKG